MQILNTTDIGIINVFAFQVCTLPIHTIQKWKKMAGQNTCQFLLLNDRRTLFRKQVDTNSEQKGDFHKRTPISILVS